LNLCGIHGCLQFDGTERICRPSELTEALDISDIKYVKSKYLENRYLILGKGFGGMESSIAYVFDVIKM